MVTNIENLSEALTRPSNRVSDEAECLADLIKSNEKIQADLRENGVAYVRDAAGRDFVVRRKATAASE